MRIPLRGTPDDWFAWLSSGQTEQRDEAKLILGGLVPEDPVAPETLMAQLQNPSTDIVFWAVIALDRLERRAAPALPALRQLATSHPAFGVRDAAIAALSRIASADPVSKQAFLYALGDESAWVRASALRAFINVPDLADTDLAAIRALAQDPESMVVHQVEITLRNIRLRTGPAA
jgi:HEAT repeat protein